MPLILAIEPDQRQAAQIAVIARNRLGAELRLAATTEQALDVIGDRVPDLVLVPALLSPQDDAALAAALRVIAAAAHVRTLTIPVLASGVRRPSNEGMLSKWRKGKTNAPAPDGCDPAIFAEQIAAYLREAAAERAELEELEQLEQLEEEPQPEEAPLAAFEQFEPTGEPEPPGHTAPPEMVDFDAPTAGSRQLFPDDQPSYVEEAPFAEAPSFVEVPSFMEARSFTETPSFVEEPPVAEAPTMVAHVEQAFVPESAPMMASTDGAIAPAAWIDVDLSGELGEAREPLYELETADAGLMLIDERIFAPFAIPAIEAASESVESVEPIARLEPVEPFEPIEPFEPFEPIAQSLGAAIERQMALDAEAIGDAAPPPVPADDDSATFAEIFAALSNVDRFVMRDEPPAAPAVRQELWMPLGLNEFRWPRIEGVTAELIELREHKRSAATVAPAAQAASLARPVPVRAAQKHEASKSDRPEWSALIASLRQDIERLRGEHQTTPPAPTAARPSQPAAARTITPPVERKWKGRAAKPIQDEWGFFDPEQCGFAALVAKLSEITDAGEETELHAH